MEGLRIWSDYNPGDSHLYMIMSDKKNGGIVHCHVRLEEDATENVLNERNSLNLLDFEMDWKGKLVSRSVSLRKA